MNRTVSVLLVACCFALPAHAYNYVEHKEIYRLAKSTLEADAGLQLQRYEADEAQVLLEGSPREQFTVDDVPALAGDYTTDVANLLSRLFLTPPTEAAVPACVDPTASETKPAPTRTMCPQVPEALVPTPSLSQGVWKRFITQQRRWEVDLRKKPAADFVLGEGQLMLLPLAFNNLSHFSIRGCEGSLETTRLGGATFEVRQALRVLPSATYGATANNKQVRNTVATVESIESAPSYYFWNHAGAMAFSALANQTADVVTQRRARALSALFEQFALHHLSDLVAPGHQQCLKANATDAAGRRVSHQRRNAGMTTTLPPALCALDAKLPESVRHACTSAEVELHGDAEAFFSKKRGEPDPLTGDVAALLARVSLEEVLAAKLSEADVKALEAQLSDVVAKPGRFCHLNALLTQASEDKRVLSLWAEGWVLGFTAPREDVTQLLHVQLMQQLAKQATVLSKLPRYSCPP